MYVYINIYIYIMCINVHHLARTSYSMYIRSYIHIL